MGVITVAVLLAASVSSGQAQASPVRRQAQDPPLVPDPLAWNMNVDDAMKALQKTNALPRQGDTRGYTASPRPVTHKIEPTIYFVPRTGWTAEARFAYSTPDKTWRMQSVSYHAALAGSTIATEVAMLERRFGKPTKAVGPQRLWVRGGIWLVVFEGTADATTKLAPFSVAYRRDDRPAP